MSGASGGLGRVRVSATPAAASATVRRASGSTGVEHSVLRDGRERGRCASCCRYAHVPVLTTHSPDLSVIGRSGRGLQSRALAPAGAGPAGSLPAGVAPPGAGPAGPVPGRRRSSGPRTNVPRTSALRDQPRPRSTPSPLQRAPFQVPPTQLVRAADACAQVGAVPRHALHVDLAGQHLTGLRVDEVAATTGRLQRSGAGGGREGLRCRQDGSRSCSCVRTPSRMATAALTTSSWPCPRASGSQSCDAVRRWTQVRP